MLRAPEIQAVCPTTADTAWVPLHYALFGRASREAATLRKRRAKPRDREKHRISNGRRNETRQLT